MYLNNQLADFKNHQMMTVSESKLIDDFLFENDFYHTISIDDKVCFKIYNNLNETKKDLIQIYWN
jgi:hypothetical protein